MDILSTTRHKARKRHKCNWCGSFIEIGQEYEREALVDGTFYEWKSHVECGQFAQNHLFNGFDDTADSSDFCCEVQEVARDKGFDSDLDEYELVKLIMEVESAC